MKRLLYILALSLNTSLLSAQYEANIWMFGDQIGIDFNSGSPVLLTNTNMKVMEGCSSMCDSEGNLLFYTNGGIISSFLPDVGAVWNRNYDIMPNGLLLDTAGCISASQGVIIVPDPASNHKYYIITTDCLENFFNNYNLHRGLRYTKVDMSLDSGLGDVVEKGVQIMDFPPGPIKSTAWEHVSAIPHSNNRDFWIIAYRYDSVCTVLLDTAGFHPYTYQGNATGHFTPSPTNDRIVVGKYLCDFNNTTGSISNLCILTVFGLHSARTAKDFMAFHTTVDYINLT